MHLNTTVGKCELWSEGSWQRQSYSCKHSLLCNYHSRPQFTAPSWRLERCGWTRCCVYIQQIRYSKFNLERHKGRREKCPDTALALTGVHTYCNWLCPQSHKHTNIHTFSATWWAPTKGFTEGLLLPGTPSHCSRFKPQHGLIRALSLMKDEQILGQTVKGLMNHLVFNVQGCVTCTWSKLFA